VQAFYAWLRAHPVLVDGVLALSLAGLGLATLGLRNQAPAVTVLFVLAMALPAALRRKYPLGAFAAALAVGGVQVFVLRRPLVTDLSVVVLLYTLAAYRSRRLSVLGLVSCLAGSAVAIARWSPAPIFASPYTLGELIAAFCGPALTAWLLGDLMQWRRGYYQALEERAARLERERDAQVQIAAAAERARIARELHDVVAHNVTVMVVQADGAGYAFDSAPEQARSALDVIARTGRSALAEMRSLLGVLRAADGDGAELAPQPGIEQVTGLLEQARASGLPVSFSVLGVPRDLPAGQALAAYRIVQESLTNARKHGGPAAAVSVTLRFYEDRLVINVTDDGRDGSAGGGGSAGKGRERGLGPPGDGLGHGLVGMRERAEAYGGTMTAGPRGGGWHVSATLPLSGAALGAALGAAS
jgi:signal transduction histidine kinase